MTAPTHPAPSPLADIGARTRDWIDVIRRSRLTPTTKLVAHTIASRADPDGTHIYPGLARLVFESGVGYSTARRSMAELVKAGLLERVRRGNRRRGQADEYRLILAEDLFDRVDVPDPEVARRHIEKINAEVTGSGRERQRRISAHVDSAKPVGNIEPKPVDNSPEQDQEEVSLTLTIESGETRSNAQNGPLLALTSARPPKDIPTPHRKRDHPSSLAGNQPVPSTTNGRQSPLLGVIDGHQPDYPIDDYQLTIPVEMPPPRPNRIRDEVLPALGAQLARINHGTAS